MNWVKWLSSRYSYTRLGANVGIPKATLSSYVKLGIKVPTGDYKTLRAFYQKVQYNRLRETGFSPLESKRFSSYSFQNVDNAINRLNYAAEKIGSREGINPNDIRSGMSKSKMTLEDLETAADQGWS